MGPLSAGKVEKLSMLLAHMSVERVDGLVDLAREMDPGMARMLEFCRYGAEGAACRQFFLPLKDAIGDRSVIEPSRALIPEALLVPLWSWISADLDPEAAAAAMDAASTFSHDLDDEALDDARVRVAGAMFETLDSLRDEPKESKRLRHQLGVTDFDEIRSIAGLLKSVPALREALDGLPDEIEKMDDEVCAELRDRYEQAIEELPESGVWVLLMTMARVHKPWRMLRVFERIARRDDDFLLTHTDMSSVGEALLSDAEFYLKGFKTTPRTPEQVERCVKAVTQFAAVTVGMTREIGIRKDGTWGKRLFELRNAASLQMEAIHEEARRMFEHALPETGPRRRTREIPHPGDPVFDEAEAVCGFLYSVKDDAARAAVGNAHAHLLDELREASEKLGEEILARLRRNVSDDVEADRARLREVTRFLDVLGMREAGEVLLRRAAAVQAA
tara:strand:+ start:4392 stop:5729 length:1338 start_codon:yes stop_codon:yes gene_type:complete